MATSWLPQESVCLKPDSILDMRLFPEKYGNMH